MRSALVIFILINSIVTMMCITQAEISDLVQSPRRLCGPMLSNAMKIVCRSDIRAKKSLYNFGEGHKLDKAIDRMLAMYEDEGSQSDEAGYGDDWLPNYVYMSQFHKRQDGLSITQACCKQACTYHVLRQYCPNTKSS